MPMSSSEVRSIIIVFNDTCFLGLHLQVKQSGKVVYVEIVFMKLTEPMGRMPGQGSVKFNERGTPFRGNTL
jgi:hypothetical protein